MLRKVTDRGRQARERLTGKVRGRIRERAITQAKVCIALHGRKIEDFSHDELEIVVADEEAKIRRRLWIVPLVAVGIVLGIT